MSKVAFQSARALTRTDMPILSENLLRNVTTGLRESNLSADADQR